MKKLIISTVLIGSLAACSTQTAVVNSQQGTPQKSEMQTFFVSGLGQTQHIDAAAVCGDSSKVAKVESSYSPINWLLGFLSSGIYTPRDAKVYCQ